MIFEVMHHPRSSSAARRLRLACFLLLASRLVALAAGVLLLVSLLSGDRSLTILGSGGMIVGFILVIAQWISASAAGCPLCRTPVLAPIGCMKHRHARTFMGSYRLRVAFAILIMDRFRCPYCNEPTAMDVRETLRSTRPRGPQMTEFTRYR